MDTDNSQFIDNIFFNLQNYLNVVKPILNNVTNEDRQEEEFVNALLEHKNVLGQIKTKLNSYGEDVKSTIQHIDDILQLGNTAGGKRRKTNQTRKKRHSRKNK